MDGDRYNFGGGEFEGKRLYRVHHGFIVPNKKFFVNTPY
jgi:hypothetical protein